MGRSLSSADSQRANRFRELYRTLLTPVGLIVTVSGVFYANLASFFGKESPLVAYQLLIGSAVVLLIASSFFYGYAQLDAQRYQRKLSQLAFGCMMIAAFVSSTVLVAPLFSMLIPAEDRTPPSIIVGLLYILVGLWQTNRFCKSKL